MVGDVKGAWVTPLIELLRPMVISIFVDHKFQKRVAQIKCEDIQLITE